MSGFSLFDFGGPPPEMRTADDKKNKTYGSPKAPASQASPASGGSVSKLNTPQVPDFLSGFASSNAGQHQAAGTTAGGPFAGNGYGSANVFGNGAASGGSSMGMMGQKQQDEDVIMTDAGTDNRPSAAEASTLGSPGAPRISLVSTTSVPKSVRTVNWTEKYRPRSLDSIAAQKRAIDLLKAATQDQEFPSFLFHGPPGVGKTTAALAFCSELFGADYNKRVLEMNASDERGIGAIRDKVKTFSQLAVGSGATHAKLNVKVIILDEADQMTKEAQSALRRIMEQYVRTTRFIILCNYVSRILPPIHSRCMKFEFSSVDNKDHLVHLKKICRCEGIQTTDEALKVLMTLAQGDLRRSTNLLQMAFTVRCCGGRKMQPISKNDFYQLYQRVPEEVLQKAVRLCCDPSPSATAQLDVFVQKEIINAGHSFSKVIDSLWDYLAQRKSYADVPLPKPISVMKRAGVNALIATANENVSIWRGSESVQLCNLFHKTREILCAPQDMEMPPPIPLAEAFPGVDFSDV